MYLLRFDGGCRGNPGHGSSAAVLYKDSKKVDYAYTCLPGKVTNNESEYMGLILGVRMAIHHGVQQLNIEGDSQLIIEHLFGTWECKHPRMKKYYQEAKRIFKHFHFIHGRWIPREQNKEADGYCNLALDTRSSHGNTEWFQIPKFEPKKNDLRHFFTVTPVDT